jgi:hypothetical protein
MECAPHLLHGLFQGNGTRPDGTDEDMAIRGLVAKKPAFLGCCQEYILDKEAADTRFGQCLQGFRVTKKVVIMTCTISAFGAKIRQ